MDLRIQKTRQLLKDALVSLTLENGYDHVTIKDITKRASVGYNTYFRHYKSKEELLHILLMDGFEKLTPMLIESKQNEDVLENEKRLFNFISNNERLIRVLFESCADLLYEQTKNKIMTGELNNIGFTKLKDELEPLEYDYIVCQFVQSTLTSIRWWLTHKDDISIVQMAKFNQKTIGHFMQWKQV
ncbi:hypothetical protein TYM08_P3889 [Marinicellulosiphila megalodicopiae]